MPSSSKNDDNKVNMTAVAIAIITVIGTITSAYFIYQANYNTISIPIGVTQTAEARLATQTAEVVDTSVPSTPTASVPRSLSPTPLSTVSVTELPCIFSGTCVPGDDWQRSCISAIWKPYLAGEIMPEPALCYQLSEWGITADNGSLVFANNKSSLTAYEYGIFTPWQNWSEVDFTVDIKHLDNSELWFGFFEGNTTSSTGIVFVIQPNDIVDVRNMPSRGAIVQNVGLPYAGGHFDPKITFAGGMFTLWIDGQGILSNWPVNFTIRNMFIGYRSLPVINLEATISNLKFTP